MKQKIQKYLFVPFLAMAIMPFWSCVNSSNSDLIYYDDAAITSFSLGKVKQFQTETDDDGEVTTSYTNLDCSSYKFAIDQQQHLIYNVDSLPVGVDPTRIVCTVGTKNGSYLRLKNVESGEYEYFSSSDSLDFTNIRKFRVTAASGQAYVDYDVEIRIHKEEADSFVWRDRVTTNATLAALTHLRAVCFDGEVLVLGVLAGATAIYSTAETDGKVWTQVSTNLSTLSDQAPYNIVVKNNELYLYDNGTLYTATDPSNWTTVGTPALTQLIGASEQKLYAINASGTISSSADNGTTWEEETLDTDAAYLPTQDISFFCTPLRTYTSSNQLVLMGNRNLTNEATAQVWGKVEQNDAAAQQQSWTYYNVSPEVKNKPPHLTNLQARTYGDGMLAFGGRAMNKSELETFAHFYYSEDGGLTWPADTTIAIPTGFASNADNFALTVDSQNYVWIICGGSGQVWKGRRNKLGWAEEQKYFYE